MPFDTTCPKCDTEFRLLDRDKGKRFKCENCSHSFMPRASRSEDEERPRRKAEIRDDGDAAPAGGYWNDRDGGGKRDGGKKEVKLGGGSRRPRKSGDDDSNAMIITVGVIAFFLLAGAGLCIWIFTQESEPEQPQPGIPIAGGGNNNNNPWPGPGPGPRNQGNPQPRQQQITDLDSDTLLARLAPNSGAAGWDIEAAINELARRKELRAVSPIAKNLTNFFMRGHAQNALKAYGPTAAPEVLTYFNHADGGAREAARSLLRDFRTSSDLLVTQCLKDAGGNVLDPQLNALGWLADQNPVPARAAEVARVQERLLLSSDGRVRENAMRGLLKWGSKENTPAIVQMLDAHAKEVFGSNTHNWGFEALGKWKDPRGVPALLQYFPNAFIGGQAKKALEQIGPAAVPEVTRFVREQSERNLTGNAVDPQLNALSWLLDQNLMADRTAEVVQVMEQLLTSTDGRIRENALKGLLKWGSKENTPAVVKELESLKKEAFMTNSHRMGFEALGKWKDPRGVPILVHYLPDFFRGGEAGKALEQFGPEAVPELTKFINHPDGNVQNRVRQLLKKIGGGGQTLAQSLTDLTAQDANLRRSAAEWLAQATVEEGKRAEVARALIPLLKDGDFRTQDLAFRAMKVWLHKEAVPGLLAILDNPAQPRAGPSRALAMEMLGSLKEEKAIEPIARLLTSIVDRRNASIVLKGMGSIAEDEVVKYLTNQDRSARIEACGILAAIGTQKSLEPLQKLSAPPARDPASRAARIALDTIKTRLNSP